jgi:hypothetical protein
MFRQLATGATVGTACAARRCQNLPRLSLPSFHGLGKMLKEESRNCLNLTGTPHVAVPYAFVELQLWVVVVGLPLLVVYEVAGVEYLGSTSALAVVLWYHTRLISERLPVRFPARRTKKHFLPLPSSPVTSPTDVIL